LGPREGTGIWERHLLNSAVVAELVPQNTELIIDVGSGAGLPGLPLALLRPSAQLVLLEPMERRCDFLRRAVALLELTDRVRVRRGRAPDAARGRDGLSAAVVTARAVAAFPALVAAAVPLLGPGGTLLAIRGERAEQELREAGPQLDRSALAGSVRHCGRGVLQTPTTVVQLRRTEGRGHDRRA